MIRFVTAIAFVACPTIAVAEAPAIYTGADATTASARLCAYGCTITPRARIIRTAVAAPVHTSADLSSAPSMEALARAQLDELIAAID